MRITARQDLLIVRDAPGCWWFAGGLFGGVGGLFVAGPLGLFTDSAELAPFARLGIVALGSCAVATGLWLLRAAPLSTVRFDRRAGHASFRRRWPIGRAERRVPLAAIRAVRLEERTDDEGGRVYRVALALRSGGTVLLSPVWSHDRAGCERAADVVRAFLVLGDAPSPDA